MVTGLYIGARLTITVFLGINALLYIAPLPLSLLYFSIETKKGRRVVTGLYYIVPLPLSVPLWLYLKIQEGEWKRD